MVAGRDCDPWLLDNDPVFDIRPRLGPHGYEQIPALVEHGRLRGRDFYADLEQRLAGNAFVAGSAFSSADITAVVTVDFATRALSVPVPGSHAATRRWYDAVSARPSFAV